MPLTDRVRPRVGDVIEIPTAHGLAYAHFTHLHEAPPRYGSLIRVLPGLFDVRPTDFSSLIGASPVFSTFVPLGAMCARKIVRVVASELVPEHTAKFPIFRNSHRDKSSRRVTPWFLWDGAREWRVESLTAAQIEEYPPLGVWNDILLVERITAGWTHAHDA